MLIQDYGLDFDGVQETMAAIDDTQVSIGNDNDAAAAAAAGDDYNGELRRLERSLQDLTSRDLVDLHSHPLKNSNSSALSNPMDIEVLRAFQESVTSRLQKQQEYV